MRLLYYCEPNRRVTLECALFVFTRRVRRALELANAVSISQFLRGERDHVSNIGRPRSRYRVSIASYSMHACMQDPLFYALAIVQWACSTRT